MSNIELIGYMILFAMGTFWGGFAVIRKSPVLAFITMVIWIVLAPIHLALAFNTVLTGIEWVFYGIGMFFMIYGIALTINTITATRKKKEWEV